VSAAQDLLVEIGTEELPPRSLRCLSQAFASAVVERLDKQSLTHGTVKAYATPRRLALGIEALAGAEPDHLVHRRGPAVRAAFDAQGRPTPAALGFARSCGVAVEDLMRWENEQGHWLAFQTLVRGRPAGLVIPGLLREALAALPIQKRMRWGPGAVEFVRPVHWVVLLYGPDILSAEVLGVRSGRESRGHRFMRPGSLSIPAPRDYPELLETIGRVQADFAERQERLRRLVEAAADAQGGQALIDPDLLEEVTGLCEWPAVIVGAFDRRFLGMPAEVLIATLQDHQKCFPILDADGRLLPYFVATSNIESRDPEVVRRGNERVVHPRLADAAFFYEQDLALPLEARRAALARIVYQERLGSLLDRSDRLAILAEEIARQIGGDPDSARRAGLLSKCDLITALVGEFPELQGLMGRHYANRAGEPAEVAEALAEQYLPRHAGDGLPGTRTGQALALADKLDLLCGGFGIGQAPSGDRDPFGLRRAALGCLRIFIEGTLDLDLFDLLSRAAALYGESIDPRVVPAVFDYMMERLRGYLAEEGGRSDTFEAVLARRPTRPLDFRERLSAVTAFRALPESAALCAANKRIANLLKQAEDLEIGVVDEGLLEAPAERRLSAALMSLEGPVREGLDRREYTAVLCALAGLREPVDAFFDEVLVLCEDRRLRANRLTLLGRVQALFLEIADLSRLQ
jgi:glycyl-tRNA synthetase beta chain